MAGGSLGLGFRAGRASFGPETGFFLGDEKLWTITGVARVDLAGRHGTGLVPYVVAGAGGYVWIHDIGNSSYLTATLGVGATLGSTRRWRIEARWHPVIQNTDSGLQPSLFTAGAGLRLGW